MSEEPENLDKLFSELAGSVSMSPLDAQAHEMHEMFLSLMRVGFSEKQALFIISMAVISLDSGEDDGDEEIIITSDYHPSDKDGSTGNSERHSSTASPSDTEEDLDDDDENEEFSS